MDESVHRSTASTAPALSRTLVADVMTTTVLAVGPDTPVTDVATVLHDGAVRAVPVLDGKGHLLGVVSEADVLATLDRPDHHGERPRHRPRHTRRTPPVPQIAARTARGLMSNPVVTVGPSTTVAAAARSMREHVVAWMPVVDADGRVLGVLGRSDVLAVFLRGDAAIRREVVEEVLGRMLVVDPARIAVEVADGVVTLTGELDTRVDVELAVRFVERLEGVVGIDDRLSCLVDHTLLDVAPLY